MKKEHIVYYSFLIFFTTLVLIIVGLYYGLRFVFHIYPFFIIISSGIVFWSINNNIKLRRYFTAFLEFLAFFFVIFVFFIIFWPRDILFMRIGMAKNIEYHEPNSISEEQIQSLLEHQPDYPLFELHGEYGTYRAEVNVNPKEEGTYYLRLFDAKGHIEVAPNEIKKQTMTPIKEVGQQVIDLSFTQFDGTCTAFFIARAELWFEPKTKSRSIKVMEKNFKVDGWIR